MRKNNRHLFASVALMFATVLSLTVFAVPKTVKAETFEPISVNKVEDINADFSGVGDTVNKHVNLPKNQDKFTESQYYQFTLDSPSYIRIKEYAYLWWGYLNGKIKFYVSNSTTFAESPLISEATDNHSGGYRSLYEPGTYYLKVEMAFDGRASYVYDDTYYSFSVFAQPVVRTGMTDGASLATAIPLQSGKPSEGAITKQNKKQYFAFKQTSDGAFKTDIVVNVPEGWTFSDMEAVLYNKAGAQIKQSSLRSNWGNSTSISVDSLAKGDYYIMVYTTDGYTNMRGVATVTVNASYKTAKELAAPKLKSYKAGTQKITGTAVKGAKVTVKVGKKTYTATAKNGKFTIKLKSKLKKGTTIKVRAAKSGYTASKTVTYKVKKAK